MIKPEMCPKPTDASAIEFLMDKQNHEWIGRNNAKMPMAISW